jgi:hypothetical protein
MKSTCFSVFLGLLLLPTGIATGCSSSQGSSTEKLLKSALDDGVDSRERVAIVRKLVSIPGDDTERALLQIAFAEKLFDSVRTEAVAGLKSRPSERVSETLARLLQPHSSLSLRMAVADYLKNSSCMLDCVSSVLHYQERMWRGEKGSEDLLATESTPGTHSAEQAKLTSDLTSVLVSNRAASLRVLSQTYGLGSKFPSLFAIETVGNLSIKEACFELANPFRIAPPHPSVREAIVRARTKLSCD